MTQNIIGFFCGTGYFKATDASYNKIKAFVKDPGNLFAYDGCQIYGGGIFAYGVEEQADAFITDLKSKVNQSEDDYQLNLVAHSRGVLSALLAIKKIQADPVLNKKIKVTADFHDPVPGNFQLTTKFAGNLASANQLQDFSECDILKKVYITLQEEPIVPIAFDALIPKFHSATSVEIETLPGYHDVQHRNRMSPKIEHNLLLEIGLYKTFSILKADGHELNGFLVLEQMQLNAYEGLILWAQTREIPFGEGPLHFGGKISANNGAKEKIEVINWRHARFKKIIPDHVLYGTTQSHYNYQKTTLEHYCDLTMRLDNFLVKNPKQHSLVQQIKTKSSKFLQGEISFPMYKEECQKLLKAASVQDKNINKSINYLCMHGYLQSLNRAITEHVIPNNPLHENLQALKVALSEELADAIESGKTIEQIENLDVIKIANNTAGFIDTIYFAKNNSQQILQAAEHYAKENISLGRNWNLGSKIITGVIICVVAAVVSCVIGAAIGFAIGWGCGWFLGPGAMIPAIMGAFIIGGVAGSAIGCYEANHFFRPSPTEKQVQTLAEHVKALSKV